MDTFKTQKKEMDPEMTERELEEVRHEVATADIGLLLREVCAKHQCTVEVVRFSRGRLFLVTLTRRDVAETGGIGGVVGDGHGPDAEAGALPAMLGALAQGGWVDPLLEADLEAGLVKATNGHIVATAMVMRVEKGPAR